ncbi:DinB family protein [Pedobacter duraquae]|uniref:DinB family protein n=1 Tax=Pedobacter duraquae TaxID=425511 RepID=A0A4V3C3D9_9SPHI|nr:DinB family protein [Pedobacter duraquae]TDO21668.1 DinB family protein [Pedobacter duraquae]
MDRIEICRACSEAFDQQEKLVAAFDTIHVNSIPFDGSWTAGQVVQHTIMANGGFLEMLNGEMTDTGRPSDLIVPRIASDFLDFSTKMDAPESLVPENILYEPAVLLQKVQHIYAGLRFVIENLDLTKTCVECELPGYGFLTRMEAVYFIVCHTKRHNYQLENIIRLLSEGTKTNIFGWLVFEFLSHSGDRLATDHTPIFW